MSMDNWYLNDPCHTVEDITRSKLSMVEYKYILFATTEVEIKEISDSNWRLMVRNSIKGIRIRMSGMFMILLLLIEK